MNHHSYSSHIGGHGCLFLKLTETKPAPKINYKRFPAETADLMGSARLKDVTPKIKAVSRISPNGGGGVRWTIPGIQTKGDFRVTFDYINAQLATGDEDDSKLNFKRTVITVNDDQKVIVDFPISGLVSILNFRYDNPRFFSTLIICFTFGLNNFQLSMYQLWEEVYEGFLVSLPLIVSAERKLICPLQQ
jgi:hypothetical protein